MSGDPHTAFRECLRSFVSQDYEVSLENSRALWDEHPSFHPEVKTV